MVSDKLTKQTQKLEMCSTLAEILADTWPTAVLPIRTTPTTPTTPTTTRGMQRPGPWPLAACRLTSLAAGCCCCYCCGCCCCSWCWWCWWCGNRIPSYPRRWVWFMAQVILRQNAGSSCNKKTSCPLQQSNHDPTAKNKLLVGRPETCIPPHVIFQSSVLLLLVLLLLLLLLFLLLLLLL